MCNPCQVSYNNAKGYAIGKMNQGRNDWLDDDCVNDVYFFIVMLK